MLALEFLLEISDLFDMFWVALDEDPEFLRRAVVVLLVSDILRSMTSSMFTVGIPALY